MKYLVNGVEYTDLKEAQKAEKEFEAEQAKKKALADTKKARANEIVEADDELTETKAAALKEYEETTSAARKLYNDTLREAKDKYFDSVKNAEDKKNNLIENFIKDFGSYHQTTTEINGKKTVTISDVMDSIFNSWFN